MVEKLACMFAIAAPHGVRGEVKVKCFVQEAQSLLSYKTFTDEAGTEVLTLEKIRPAKADLAVATFVEISDRVTAEAWRGKQLYVPRARLPALGNDAVFYHQDLIGMHLVAPEGPDKILGTVQGVHNFGAGDILDIRLKHGESVLIPFKAEYFPTVDITQGHLTVNEAAIKPFLELGAS